jgi:hypothetical protein
METLKPCLAPARVEPAYEDPDRIRQLVVRHAPFPTLVSVDGFLGIAAVPPWFRSRWAMDGVALVEGVEAILDNEPFAEASRRVFECPIVRPTNVIVNLMGPMPEGVAHVDTPTFRGLPRQATPTWLLLTMGASGLFERWAVRASSAVSWFYDGGDGAFEYWPDGPGGAMASEPAPFGNVAVVGDQDRMFHRVGPIGDPGDFLAPGLLTADSRLAPTGGGEWHVLEGNRVVAVLGAGAVRVSVLWRANVFPDESAAAAFADHTDDLTPADVVAVFRDDLARRDLAVPEPSDPFADPDWQAVLTREYPLATV